MLCLSSNVAVIWWNSCQLAYQICCMATYFPAFKSWIHFRKHNKFTGIFHFLPFLDNEIGHVAENLSCRTWWCHQMKTFSTLLAICAGNSPVIGEFVAQRPVTRSFDDFFDLRLNIRLSKQSRGWWFETPSYPLWRHCNETGVPCVFYMDAMSWRQKGARASAAKVFLVI